MASITLRGITKRFDSAVAVSNIDLSIGDGSFFCLIGPSGCGKTTLLRLIAGFETPDEGGIFFDNDDVTLLPCEARGVAVVFQQYALWPHMTVEGNLQFGLDAQKVPQREQGARLEAALEMVRLSTLATRYPHELSGGQQQRVAVARALVLRPKVILLDEPLSNLDPALRVEVREEIKELQRQLGTTMVYVTHDHMEALSTADEIAVLKQGKIAQRGTPSGIYSRPDSVFVGSFLGEMNYFDGVGCEGNRIKIDGDVIFDVTASIHPGQTTRLGIRPEKFSLTPSPGARSLKAEIERSSFHGSTTVVRVKVSPKVSLSVLTIGAVSIGQGQSIELYYHPNDVMIFGS